MNFKKLMEYKEKSPWDTPIPTLAFLGDSVTQGCFEIYVDESGKIQTYCEPWNGYASSLVRRLWEKYPLSPLNAIYAGVSGDNAENGLKRIDKDVLAYHPDLTVVSYGLNDCKKINGRLALYEKSLTGIFERLKDSGSEIIFLTENMMNTKPFEYENKALRDLTYSTMELQNSGLLTEFFEKGKAVAEKMGVTVCDGHKLWLDLYKSGVDTDAMLANHVNHPTREAAQLFTNALFEIITE